MHNNYYFLKHLSKALDDLLAGYEAFECFTQNRNELIIGFSKKSSVFYIKAHLDPSFCCLSFPDSFSRARKNSTDLMKDLIKKKVTHVYQFQNERCFSIEFEDDYRLLFKMHGNRSNLVLFRKNMVTEVFRKNLSKDFTLDITALDRPIDQSYENFVEHNGDYSILFPTFGKEINQYLTRQGVETADLETKWNLIQAVLKHLESPNFYLTGSEGKPQLSMLPTGANQEVFKDPLEAINTFFIRYITQASLLSLRHQAGLAIEKNIRQSKNYIKKTKTKLQEIESQANYSWLADIIMANLHRINPKADEVILENFYDGNRPIQIKLKRDLSPQKNAENYYRKAKNQGKEIENLRANLLQKTQVLEMLEEQKRLIEGIDDLKALQKMLKTPVIKVTQPSRPYNPYNFGGFDIWVGKNAQSNDKMLQQYSYKEDLWLHAREVTGSHVLIKHQAGKKFPKDVVEKAAELAAWYSKRRTDSLCPVIVTPRKFVRKRKGDPAGAVVVDKEEQILLVSPANWTDKQG